MSFSRLFFHLSAEKEALEVERKKHTDKERERIEYLVYNLSLNDVPGMAECNGDWAAAERKGFDPFAWLRWLFVSALKQNIDTEPLLRRLNEQVPEPVIQRIFAK